MKKHILSLVLLLFSIHSWAEEKIILTSDGVKLYVKVEGSGTPLLYLHGGPGSGSFWFEKFSGDFMENHFTMVYLDQRGVGRSSSPADNNYSMDRMALDFEEVRKELGFKSWLTLGHSFGGILQMGYMERYPEANQGMIMVNCTLSIKESFCGSWAPKAAEFLGNTEDFSCAPDGQNLLPRIIYLGNKLRENKIFWKMGFTEEANEALVNSTTNEIEDWNYDFGGTALDIQDYWVNYRSKTSPIEQPVLFFYGTQDWMVGPEHYKTVNFPQMILWKSEGGHFPFLENKQDLETAVLEYKKKFLF